RAEPSSSSVPTGISRGSCSYPALPNYVSRGAHKLIAALDEFHVEVDGRIALDAGASTGGFSQVLLERGAALVLAVDVGHGQLSPEL
ncbi:SAM-dependent methyltransferase, partial [Rhizobium johnstonii]|uniref:SAM-dependent methyltransferase n=1 Tax=Rhizobium johnstonii TaxID=3019933 RepID=UPI003F9548A8